MAAKVKLTRPELKRYRDVLTRLQRYLPMLKLKQQQLQMALRQISQHRRQAQAALEAAQQVVAPYRAVLRDVAGVNVEQLSRPSEVKTATRNVAGVTIPVLAEVVFPPAAYSLFATPAWVDQALADRREVSRRRVELDVLEEQNRLLRRELTKISQRVNLFEKVKIPEAREIIRRIRIKLGDEMTAAVGRAKMAKAKIAEGGSFDDLELPDVAEALENS